MPLTSEAVAPGTRPAIDANEPDRTAVMVIVVAAVATVVLLLVLGRGRTFFYDEWDWIGSRSSGGLHTLLDAHNEHISIVPAALFRLLFETVGLDQTWPYRLLPALAHAAIGLVVFSIARRRVGEWGAAVVALLVLGLGVAWQDTLWAFQIGFLASVLGGLVAWDALDRGTTRADVVAVLALVVAITSSSLGIPIALGVAVELLVARRVRALWIAGVPLVVYGLWYLGYGDSGELTRRGLEHAPQWAVDAAAAAAGGLAGRGLDWGRPLLLVAVAAAVVAVARRGATPRLVGVLAAGVAFWLLTGATRGPGGSTPEVPDTSRYTELGAVILGLAAVEVLRGARLTRRMRGVAIAVTAVCLLQGLETLNNGANSLRDNSDKVKARLAAAALVQPRLPAGYRLAPQDAPQIVAGAYVNAVKKLGSSPVPDPGAVLAAAKPAALAGADDVLRAIDVAVNPPGAGARACPAAAATADRRAQLRAGQLQVQAGGAPVAVAVGRYAPGETPLTEVPAGARRLVGFVTDASARPWRLHLTSPAPFRLCGS